MAVAKILKMSAFMTGRTNCARVVVAVCIACVVTSCSIAIDQSDPTKNLPPGAAADITPAPDSINTDPTPVLTYPEVNIDTSTFVAEVRVATIYPKRANSITGVVPTRDPGLLFGEDGPSTEKQLYVPILLEVLHVYLDEIGLQDEWGVLVNEYVGVAADMGSPIGKRWIDPGTLSVGDEAIVFLTEYYPTSRDRPEYQFLQDEATTLTSHGRPTTAMKQGEWYKFVGSNAINPMRPTLTFTIDELRERINNYVSN